MDKKTRNLIIAGVLAVLVLIGLVQTYQLYTLKSSGGILTTNTASSSSSVASGSQQSTPSDTPNNLQNLPSMVGGC